MVACEHIVPATSSQMFSCTPDLVVVRQVECVGVHLDKLKIGLKLVQSELLISTMTCLMHSWVLFHVKHHFKGPGRLIEPLCH